MEFIYTVDPFAEEPIMLINKHIGFDDIDGLGIMGDLFQKELLALDGMDKKRIQVWINSPGGIVMDGYSIYNAILKSKTKVDTYCVGIAASIAAVIFQAGSKRIMSDYGVLMYHNPYGGDDKAQLDTMKASIVTMVASRSGKTESEVSKMMDKTSWITASESKDSGLCDSVEHSANHNKRRMPIEAKAMWLESNKILNSSLNISNNNITNNNKTTVMTKITMKLGLNDAATEDNVISAIKDIEDRAYKAETEVIAAEKTLQEVENAAKKSKSDLEEEMDKLKNEMENGKKAFDKLKSEYDAMVEDKAKAEEAVTEEKAKNMVENFAKVGRIKNDAAAKLKWTNLAKADFEATKAMIEELPLNKEAVTITVENKLSEGELATTAMGLAVKNKLKREGKI